MTAEGHVRKILLAHNIKNISVRQIEEIVDMFTRLGVRSKRPYVDESKAAK